MVFLLITKATARICCVLLPVKRMNAQNGCEIIRIVELGKGCVAGSLPRRANQRLASLGKKGLFPVVRYLAGYIL
jgi:hypothetical protein